MSWKVGLSLYHQRLPKRRCLSEKFSSILTVHVLIRDTSLGFHVNVSAPLVATGRMASPAEELMRFPRGPKSEVGIVGVGTPLMTGMPSGELLKSPPRSASVMVCPDVVEFFEVLVRSKDRKKKVLVVRL